VSSPSSTRRWRAAGVINKIVASATHATPARCSAREAPGSRGNASISVAAKPKPSSACTPGSTMRISVSTCSTRCASGVISRSGPSAAPRGPGPRSESGSAYQSPAAVAARPPAASALVAEPAAPSSAT